MPQIVDHRTDSLTNPMLVRFKESTMLDMRTLLRGAVAAAFAIVIAFTASSFAADILDDWATVKAPPPIELKPVKVDGPTTALLILDMMKMNCGARPRCVATRARRQEAARPGAQGRDAWCGTASSAATARPPPRTRSIRRLRPKTANGRARTGRTNSSVRIWRRS